MTLIRWIELKTLTDTRGELCVAEIGTQLSFSPRRVYYLRNPRPDEPRGFHAHKTLEQIAVCVTGACTFVLDDGQTRESVRMRDGTRGLYLGPMLWHEMHDFTPDCVLLVLASDIYDEADYIRDFNEFREIVNG
nr:WxcM-like domain-containing protein [Rhizobium sp. Khangiran2]